MTLRFTIDEFRKIPNNDKILFGVLIAIILVNSMIPRVREGATLMGVSVPAITYVDRGSMGVKGGAVRSISGTFTLQTPLPASGTITFSFPSGASTYTGDSGDSFRHSIALIICNDR